MGFDIARFGLGLACGLFGWTFLEYVIHAWLGHLPRGRGTVSAEHFAHHRDILYFSPLPKKLLGAVPILGGGLALAWLGAGPSFAVGFFLALATGWTVYEWLHQEIHVRCPKSPYARWATRHHLAHHFTEPRKNYGVTTPLWDHVFGTYAPVTSVRIPRAQRQRIPWVDFEEAKAILEVAPD